MVGIFATHGHLGVPCFQGNVVFASNSSHNPLSSSGFSLRLRPSFMVDFGVGKRLVKRGSGFRASLEGGSEGKSVGGAILNKDFEFKPSFGDYLKVMESVKTVRAKKLDKHKPVGDFKGTALVDGNVKEGNLKKEKKPRFVEKGGSFRSRDRFKVHDSRRKMRGRFGDEERVAVGKGKWNPGRAGGDRNWMKQQTRVEDDEEEDNDKETKRENGYRARSSTTFEEGQRDYRSTDEVGNSEKMKMKGRRFGGEERGAFAKEKWSPGKVAVDRNWVKQQTRVEDDEEEDADEDMKRENGYRAMSSTTFEKRERDYRSTDEVASREKSDVGVNKFHEGLERSRARDSNVVDKGDIVPNQGRLNGRYETFEGNSLDVERATLRNHSDENNDRMGGRRRSREENAVDRVKQQTREETEEEDTDKEMRRETGSRARSSDMFEKRQRGYRSTGEVANREKTDVGLERQWDNFREGLERSRSRDSNVVDKSDIVPNQGRLNGRYETFEDNNLDVEKAAFRNLSHEVNDRMGGRWRRHEENVGDRNWVKRQTREEAEEEEEDTDKEMRRENRYGARSFDTFEKRQWDYRPTGEVANREKTDVRINKFHEGLERSRARDSNIVGKADIVSNKGRLNGRYETFEKNNVDVERAAFRHLNDEVNDLMDGRRRPRVEMDERIQKLAKSLNGADVDIPEWMFSKTIRSAQIIFTDHSISRLIQILGKYGNWRRVLQVLEWLQIRERFKSHKLRYVYTTALYVLGKARRPVEALNVFNAMRQEMASYPDLVAYHSIAVTLGQAGHMNELFDVIDAMRSPPSKKFKTGALGNWDPRLEPDIIVYNAVLNACVQQKQWEGAFWVLQQLKEKDLDPSVTTYGLVMEVMFSCGKYNLVHDFFKKVQKLFIPNALTYRVLVNTLWKEGKLDEAVQAINDMEKRGIVGSAALYYDFARCLCSNGRSRDALKQVEKICKVANKPLVVTYTGLIQACINSGNVNDGAHIFNHMKNFCAPNLVTCNIMMKGYLEHGMFNEAKELFEEMLEGGSRIKSQNDHKVSVAPDIYTFNTILEICAAEKRWDDFEYAYKKMLRHRHHFNSKRHLQMIHDASRAGKGELLDITWNHFIQFDRSPPTSLVKVRFCAKLEKEDYACALSCICNQNLEGSPEFSMKAWMKLLDQNRLKFPEGFLFRLVHEITNITATTKQLNPVMDNLLESCKELSKTSVVVVANVEQL